MFPTIRESAAVVSIILLLMLFLPSRLPARYRKGGTMVRFLVTTQRERNRGIYQN